MATCTIALSNPHVAFTVFIDTRGLAILFTTIVLTELQLNASVTVTVYEPAKRSVKSFVVDPLLKIN